MDKRKANRFVALDLTLIGILLALIVSTPFLVNRGFNRLDEEVVEALVILILTVVTIRVFALYHREIRQKEHSIAQFARHVGTLNLQVEQIGSLFREIEDWSRQHRSLQHLFALLADRVIEVVNADWVVLRIIESESGRTLAECSRTRARTYRSLPVISNRRLIQTTNLRDYSVIGQDLLHLKTRCVLPVKQLTETQALLIRVILDSLSLLYVVVNLSNHRRQF